MSTKPNSTPNIGNNSNKVKSPEDLRLENLARRKREIGQMVMSQLMDQVAGKLPVGAQDLQENEDFKKLCKKYENDVRHEGETTDLNKITNLLNIDADGIQTIKDFIDMAEKGLEESEGREYFQEAQHSTKAIIESIKMTGSARVVGPDGKLYDMNLVALDGDSDAYKGRVTDLETIGDNLVKGDHGGIYDANLVSVLTLYGSYFAQSNIAELEEYLDAASTEVDSYPDEDGAYSFKRADNGEGTVAQYNYTYTPKDVNQAAESSVYPATLLYTIHKNQLWENALIENEQNSDADKTAVFNVNGSGAKETDPTSGSGSKVVVEIVAANDPNSGETGKTNNTEAAAQKAGEAASKLSGTIETVNDHKSELDNMLSEYDATGNLLLPSWIPKEVWSKTLLGMIFGRSNGITKGKFVPAFIQLNDEYKLGLSSKDIKDLASRAGSVSAKESSNKEKTFEIERSVKNTVAGGLSRKDVENGVKTRDIAKNGVPGDDNFGRVVGDHSTLFTLADGMGGYLGGAEASKRVIEAFREQSVTKITGKEPVSEIIAQAVANMEKRIAGARERVALYNREQSINSGSTVVSAEVIGDRLVYGSVGDSSIFVIRDGKFILVAGDRGGHSNEISNAIDSTGVEFSEKIIPGESGNPDENVIKTVAIAKSNPMPERVLSVVPDIDRLSRQERQNDREAARLIRVINSYDNIGVFNLQDGDRIVMCSDGIMGDWSDIEGLSNYPGRGEETLTDEELVSAVEGGTTEEALQRLLEAAKKIDDRSAIIFDVELAT